MQNEPEIKENWTRVYTAVLLFLVLEIVVFYLISNHF